MDNKELPLGFGMALSQNPNAMNTFSNLTDEERQEVLAQAHKVNSKSEMQSIVENLSSNE